ncbi:MAG: bifunctional metallophosphatase/5'-nucleotidase [Gammaproteobacteria bacterium]|nr:bifunctional metallophosphatase/5'-nucleotidase [Gammaproteobacteria bacterium]
MTSILKRCTLSVLVALLLYSCAAPPESRMVSLPDETISFLHLNDTYRVGAVEDGNRGGFGRVATIIRGLQDQGRTVRVLHGGDFLYPSLESQLWNGEQMVEGMNFLHTLAPMYVVPGNHEFDRRTPTATINAIRQSKFEWLADNIRLTSGDDEADQRLRSQFIAEIGGRKIGIFALTVLPEHGGNTRDYLSFRTVYVDEAERVIREFEAAGVDLIIGLTHLLLADDIKVAALKANHPKFLFVAGGHDHEPEHELATPSSAEVMKGASNARSIWQIDVTFDHNSVPSIETRMIDLDANVAQDAEYQLIADKWRDRLLAKMPFLTSRIGEAAVPLDGREVAVRSEESNWGDFIADQMRGAFGKPLADLAFINGGTLRIDDYIAGDITFEDIGRTFGFSSFLAYLDMTGGEFRATLEAGYRGTGLGKGYFPQISGFRVCVDRSRPNGDRIVQMQVPIDDGWADIEIDKEYTVVAPDYLLRGGDGYRFPSHRERSRPGSELKYLVLDAVVRAQAAGLKVGALVDPKNPRIQFAGDDGDKCFQ